MILWDGPQTDSLVIISTLFQTPCNYFNGKKLINLNNGPVVNILEFCRFCNFCLECSTPHLVCLVNVCWSLNILQRILPGLLAWIRSSPYFLYYLKNIYFIIYMKRLISIHPGGFVMLPWFNC